MVFIGLRFTPQNGTADFRRATPKRNRPNFDFKKRNVSFLRNVSSGKSEKGKGKRKRVKPSALISP